MTQQHSRQADETSRRLRQAARRQAMAAIFLTFFSMFSPAPDLRPKPILPVKYQMIKPADPPDFGFDAAWLDEPPAPDTTLSSAVDDIS
jgi:hypothetical protein